MPRCYLHIGLQKTGTSYLQAVFWQSQAALAAEGLRMLPGTKASTFALMLAARERGGADPGALEALADELRASLAEGDTSTYLTTQESLAPASTEQVRRLVARLTGVEVHVVVTVRDLARQLPSVWQQKLSARKSYTFEEFLDAVVARSPRAREFWDSQDLPSVLDRWSAAVPSERIHVVTVPPVGSPPGLLLERFCRVLSVDPSVVDPEVPRANAALGRGQAELLRRVNLALGDRLATRQANRPVKLYFAKRVLAAQKGSPTLAPARLEEWCRETSATHQRHLRLGGYDVVGSLEDLAPRTESFTEEDQTAVEQEVSEAAVAAIATMLVDRHRGTTRRAKGARPAGLLHRLRRRVGP
jgi:hypothetical protein